jgi:hypothetical protein
MPTMRLVFTCVFTMLLGTGCSTVLAQNCGLSGTAAWNQALRNVIADCPDKFVSPDGRLALRIASDGTMSLWPESGQEKLHWTGLKLEPPAMLSWSPESNAFFLNDGEGSGMSSTFRLFRIRGATISEDKSFEQAAVSLYRHRTNCNSSAADPNVWGFGWGAQGGKIFLLVQPTANESCGRPDDFISLIVRTSDGSIAELLSKTQTKVRFGSQLPSSLFSK